MKTKLYSLLIALALLSPINAQFLTAHAQGAGVDYSVPLNPTKLPVLPLNPSNLLFVIMGDSLSGTFLPDVDTAKGLPAHWPNPNPVLGTNTWPTYFFSVGQNNALFSGTTSSNVLNWAVSGSYVSDNLLLYSNASVLSPHKIATWPNQQRYFVMMCGVNDLSALLPFNPEGVWTLPTIETNFLMIWQAAKRDGYTVIASTITGYNDPNNSWYNQSNPLDTNLLALNIWIVSQSSQWDALIDAYNIVTTNNIVSGPHWNGAGCQQFAAALNGIISITALTNLSAPPTLSISQPIVLTYTNNGFYYLLQENTNLSSTNWITITNTILNGTIGNQTIFILPRNTPQMFFRLQN
jgi:hypothetical protein